MTFWFQFSNVCHNGRQLGDDLSIDLERWDVAAWVDIFILFITEAAIRRDLVVLTIIRGCLDLT